MYHESTSFSWRCQGKLLYSVWILRGDKSGFDVPAVASQQSLTGLIWSFVEQSSI